MAIDGSQNDFRLNPFVNIRLSQPSSPVESNPPPLSQNGVDADYTIHLREWLNKWNDGGREKIVEKAINCGASPSSTAGSFTITLTPRLQDFIRQLMQYSIVGLIHPEKLTDVLVQLGQKFHGYVDQKHSDAMDVDAMGPESAPFDSTLGSEESATSNLESENYLRFLSDCLFIFDTLTCEESLDGRSVVRAGGTEKGNLKLLAECLMERQLIPRHLLVELLDGGFLEELQILNSSMISTEERRIRATKTYTQPIFSLALEEVEGFMNLIAVLAQTLQTYRKRVPQSFCQRSVDGRILPGDICPLTGYRSAELQEMVNGLWDKINDIVVQHKLAYFRVIDILLRAFAASVGNHWALFLTLFETCPWKISKKTISKNEPRTAELANDDIAQVLSFLFERFHASSDPTPHGYTAKFHQTRNDKFSSAKTSFSSLSRFLKPDYDVLSRVDADLEDMKAHTVPEASETRDSRVGDRKTSKEKDKSKTTYREKDWGYVLDIVNVAFGQDPLDGYYLVAALLVKHNVIHLENIWDRLYPNDIEEYTVPYIKTWKDCLDYLILQNPKPKSPDLELNSYYEAAAIDDVEALKLPPFQKSGFLAALLSIGDIEHASILLSKYGSDDKWALCNPDIADLICRILEKIIEPCYFSCQRISRFPPRTSTPLSTLLPTISTLPLPRREYFFYTCWTDQLQYSRSCDDVLPMILPWLDFVGIGAARSQRLIIKLCRIAETQLAQNVSDRSSKFNWLLFFERFVLPTLTLNAGSPALSREIWVFMRHLEYSERYKMYHNWKMQLSSSEMKLAARTANSCMSYLLKRLAKENVRSQGRIIGKIAHSNPHVVFDRILEQIRVAPNFAVTVVDACKYGTELAYDVFTCSIIDMLIRKSGNHDLTLQNVSEFIGLLFKKYSALDLTGIMVYIKQSVKSGRIKELGILRELIEKMSGIADVPDLTDEQLEALSGGDTLRHEVVVDTNMKNLKKPSARLTKALTENNLVLPYLIVLAQERKLSARVPDITYDNVFDLKDSNLKDLSLFHDMVHGTFIQYVEFLMQNLSPQKYAEVIPPLSKFITDYHLEIETAFFICRNKVKFGLQITSDERQSPKGFDESPMIVDMVQAVESSVSSQAWESFTPTFYVMFWQLNLYDIHVPERRYSLEIEKQKTKIKELERHIIADPSQKERFVREKEKSLDLISQYTRECSEQSSNYNDTLTRLSQDKDCWFNEFTAPHLIAENFLQYCVVPRVTFSPNDAIFCAKFIMLIHSMGTASFCTFRVYDLIFTNIGFINGLTENQAKNFGRFLNEILTVLSSWHSNEKKYMMEALGENKLPGFQRVFETRKAQVELFNPESLVSHKDFKVALGKWYSRMTMFFVQALSSDRPLQFRNALHVLLRINAHFPAATQHGNKITVGVQRLLDLNDPGVKVLALGYMPLLKKSQARWTDIEIFTGIAMTKSKPKVTNLSTEKSQKLSPSKYPPGLKREPTTPTMPKPPATPPRPTDEAAVALTIVPLDDKAQKDAATTESPKGGGVDWDGADGKGDRDRSYGQPQLAHGDNSGQVEDKPDQKSISVEEKTAATYEPSRRSMTSVGAEYDDSRRRMDDRSSRERGTPERRTARGDIVDSRRQYRDDKVRPEYKDREIEPRPSSRVDEYGAAPSRPKDATVDDRPHTSQQPTSRRSVRDNEVSAVAGAPAGSGVFQRLGPKRTSDSSLPGGDSNSGLSTVELDNGVKQASSKTNYEMTERGEQKMVPDLPTARDKRGSRTPPNSQDHVTSREHVQNISSDRDDKRPLDNRSRLTRSNSGRSASKESELRNYLVGASKDDRKREYRPEKDSAERSVKRLRSDGSQATPGDVYNPPKNQHPSEIKESDQKYHGSAAPEQDHSRYRRTDGHSHAPAPSRSGSSAPRNAGGVRDRLSHLRNNSNNASSNRNGRGERR
ncbi:transcription factor/nuclear export subunit protein 2-domain-containing protein [Paraphysoderma sedebokerense]|nr:transcription factor/nuclear export subunit protein 2-domain-containing protein [Paraphysoderma sedebokerense]